MHGESDERDEAADDGVPIENAGQDAGLPVGPERQEEVAVGVERNAAENIGEGRAVKDGEQDAGKAEEAVEERSPHADIDVIAQLKRHAAQDEQPENDHEGEIEAREGRGVEQRKGEVERAAAGEQPDFVAVPDGADGGQRGAAIGLGADEKQVQHAYAEIEAVEDHVADDHYGNEPEPE